MSHANEIPSFYKQKSLTTKRKEKLQNNSFKLKMKLLFYSLRMVRLDETFPCEAIKFYNANSYLFVELAFIDTQFRMKYYPVAFSAIKIQYERFT